jgi:hypothetical protein
LPDDEQALAILDGSGPSLPAAFAHYDPGMSSSKTSLVSSAPNTNCGPLTDAYAAGLIDGEGCLYLAGDSRKAWYYPRLDVGMTEKARPVLIRLVQTYGGTVRQTRKATKEWNAALCWTVMGKSIEPFLKRIVPYLDLKAEQGRMLLRFFELKATLPNRPNGMTMWTDEAKQTVRVMQKLLQEMNHKGPVLTQQAGFARVVEGRWISAQVSLFHPTGCEEFSGTWPAAGTMRNGIVSPLRSLVPRTSATASSSWPTATANDASRMWPTPAATDGKGANPLDRRPDCDDDLPTRVVRLWPTPIWRSPQARDGMERGPSSPERRVEQGHSVSLHDQIGGQLNPMWVEWLMGFPIGWTALERSATPSSPRSRNGSGGRSSRSIRNDD